MKRVSAALSFLILFSLSSTAPADAIFGLSKCEKVKTQIISLESEMTKYLNSVLGQYHTNNIEGYDTKIFVLTADAVRNIDFLTKLNPVPTIWKVSYNNPKCFSNTQKLRIKELEKLTTANFASYGTKQKYTFSKYCKGADSLFSTNKKKMKECFIADVKVIVNYMEYKSIYEY